MTSISSRAALVCLLLAASTGAHLSAQTRQQQKPPSPPPVEAPADRTPVEQETPAFRRPIFRALQNYTVRADDVVREVRTVFGDVTVEGHVEQDVVVIMGSAHIASTAVIGASVVVVGGGADVAEGAVIGRDFVVIGGTVTAPSSFSPGGDHVAIGSPFFGEVLNDVLPWVTRGLLWGRLIVPDLAWVWGVVAVFFLLYLALNTVFDGPVGATADVAVDRPISSFVGGLLVLLLSVPALAIVAASVIGLAIVPFLLCGLVVAGLLGKTAVARAIGRSVMRTGAPEGRSTALFAFLVGFALLTLAYMVPLLGFVTWALTSVLGLGAATATLRAHLRRERRVAVPVQDIAVVPVSSPAVATGDEHASVPPPPGTAVSMGEPAPPSPIFDKGLAHYPRATFLDRIAAFALDCILVAIANSLLFDTHRNDNFFFFLLLAYHIAFWAWKGTTLGGIICNLRVTRTDGTNLRFVDAVVRGLSAIFSIAALGIGCFWMLQDPERQMWHDKIAGTLVVKVPRNLVLP
jgi:uncharacterized RDD family membrane protein YckC